MPVVGDVDGDVVADVEGDDAERPAASTGAWWGSSRARQVGQRGPALRGDRVAAAVVGAEQQPGAVGAGQLAQPALAGGDRQERIQQGLHAVGRRRGQPLLHLGGQVDGTRPQQGLALGLGGGKLRHPAARLARGTSATVRQPRRICRLTIT